MADRDDFKTILMYLTIFIVGMAPASGASSSDSDLSRQMSTFMQQLESDALTPPSYTLAIASGDDLLYSRTRGNQVLGDGNPVTMDTRFYIASVTKSFMGLLAAKLDADGIIPLDSTLADMWPSLELPEPLDASTITMIDLLSHTSGILNDVLVIRTAYTGGAGTNLYEEILERNSTALDRTFDYENIGYLVYAAIVEQQTGRSWQDWLATDIHTPLGLTTAVNHTSKVDISVLGLGNDLAPLNRNGWSAAAAKADDLMHPAGGHFISSNDMVKWLQAHVNRSVFSPSIYDSAHQPYAARTPAKKYSDMTCGGYGLGWNTCQYAGRKVMYHGGTYNGMMIFVGFMPEDNLVISSINGARAYGWTFGWNSFLQGIDYALGLDAADANAKRRLEGRAASRMRYLNYRVRVREQALRAATTLEAATLRVAITGSFHSPDYGSATVCETDGKLLFNTGHYSAEMITGPNQTAFLLERAYGEPEEVELGKDSATGALTFTWQGGLFKHVSEGGCIGTEAKAG